MMQQFRTKDNNEVETKKFFSPFEFKASDEEEGFFEGHAAIFDKADRHGDVIKPGAFKKSLHRRPAKKVKMLFGHDTQSMIGVWDSVKEDSRGLFVKGHLLLQLSKAQEAFILLKEGVLDSMSIGFSTILAKDNNKRGMFARNLLELDLFEISLVAIPAQSGALVTSVKDASPEEIITKLDLEKVLRNAEFSESTAKYICAGWNPPARRNAEGGKDELVASIRRVTENMKTATGN